MAHKVFTLPSGLRVTVHKRRGNRNMRLSISPAGTIRVSIPAWAPYSTGVNFAQSRETWIRSQYSPRAILRPGQAIGKGHHMQFVPKAGLSKPGSRISGSSILVNYPMDTHPTDDTVQAAAHEGAVRSLRRQAEQLLPQRLAALAAHYDFSYREVRIKRLKSRWGSCDHEKRIVLNLFLMQLPWELIDYVLLHELTHTRVLRHGPDFWEAMQTVSPHSKELRKRLRDYQPALMND